MGPVTLDKKEKLFINDINQHCVNLTEIQPTGSIEDLLNRKMSKRSNSTYAMDAAGNITILYLILLSTNLPSQNELPATIGNLGSLRKLTVDGGHIKNCPKASQNTLC